MNRRLAIAALAAVVLLAGCGGGSTQQSPPRPPALGSLSGSGAGHRFYEIYEPAGTPRGTLLMFHGGGWEDTPGLARKSLALTSLALRDQGWRVVNVAYTAGYTPGGGGNPTAMLDDVVAFYEQARRAFNGPICAYGESAGGHLAAMLAIERPSLHCLILNAAPLDLVTLQHQTIPDLQQIIKKAFGADLRAWSPALLWKARQDHTPTFATAASNDTIVPAPQLSAFEAADRFVDGQVVPGAAAGAANAVPWMHSVVDRTAIDARLAALDKWLNSYVPPRASTAARPEGGSIGCSDRPAAGSQLMRQGDAWQLSSTDSQPIAATRGCSGSEQSQDAGLSLWALPGSSSVALGTEASMSLHSAHAIGRLTVSFRGYLARPSDWVLGLYAASAAGGPVTPVAACNRGACSGGLGLVTAAGGGLLTRAGSHADPDASNVAPSASFALPAGTHFLTWQLRCANPAGCSLLGTYAGSQSARPRDPLGQPAIFSIYQVSAG